MCCVVLCVLCRDEFDIKKQMEVLDESIMMVRGNVTDQLPAPCLCHPVTATLSLSPCLCLACPPLTAITAITALLCVCDCICVPPLSPLCSILPLPSAARCLTQGAAWERAWTS